MIEKIKQRFGGSVKVLSIQEYYLDKWITYNSDLNIEKQIEECLGNGATIISFHCTIETVDEETKEISLNDIYPDEKV